MASKLKFEYDLPKDAVIITPLGPIPIGTVEEYNDNNGRVSVTIKFFEKVPEELKKKVQDNPRGLSLVGKQGKPENVLRWEEPDLIIPK